MKSFVLKYNIGPKELNFFTLGKKNVSERPNFPQKCKRTVGEHVGRGRQVETVLHFF